MSSVQLENVSWKEILLLSMQLWDLLSANEESPSMQSQITTKLISIKRSWCNVQCFDIMNMYYRLMMLCGKVIPIPTIFVGNSSSQNLSSSREKKQGLQLCQQ